MNDTNHNQPQSNDDLLNRLVGELRSQPVPPLPEKLRGWSPDKAVSPKSNGVAKWLVLAAVAASVCLAVGVTCWRLWPTKPAEPNIVEKSQQQGVEGIADATIVSAISVENELAAIESGLNDIDAEIASLKQQAKLLDARRKAGELMDSFTQTKRTSHLSTEETNYEYLTSN